MKFFDLFTRRETIDSKREVTSEVEKVEEKEFVPTLSIPESWNVSQEEQYVYQFYTQELGAVPLEQISVKGFDLTKDKLTNQITITAILVNGYTHDVLLGDTEVLVLSKENQVVAKEVLNLADLETLPGRSSRPWVFQFDESSILVDPLPNEWTLAFNLAYEAKRTFLIERNLERQLPETVKDSIREVALSLPPFRSNEINSLGIHKERIENGDLYVMFLVNSGMNSPVDIPVMSFEINGPKGLICRTTLHLNDHSVPPRATKLFAATVPARLVNSMNDTEDNWHIHLIK